MAHTSSPLSFDPRHFPIDDQLIPWGVSLDEAEALLSPRPWLRPFGGWPNLRCACRAVLGLPAVECNLRGPARRKPVMEVSYELATPPDHAGTGPADPAYWVTSLTHVLGPPSQAGPTSFAHGGWSSVAYTAKWAGPLLSVGLSVFGGVRQAESGLASAGLYFDWQDELTAARPFYEAAQAASAALAARFSQLTTRAQVFDTQQQQRIFGYDHTPLPTGVPVTETHWRQSQRALYQDGLLKTPAPLQGRLRNEQVALWPVPGQAAWALSTHYDTVVLAHTGAPAVELLTIHPAKGAGYMALSAGDLRLSDRYGAPGLPKLAAALEQAGFSVSRYEDHDC
ncbi:hypothetical protein [Hymenobacter sp. CRA2]|uniref:hypothetical protein n=1 Tax=Hymenobacter sp. CRA2 TaxID=1955620 RepID=UPI00098FB121|nr:hypothetical protein [Hymenobacter sp. CRA2]OON69465.1 hypothetical protein B0919_09325 [Hymenobacter sp. CRA2]